MHNSMASANIPTLMFATCNYIIIIIIIHQHTENLFYITNFATDK